MASDTLFSPTLVSEKTQASLPEGYSFRPLQRSDYKNGHLEPLRDLTHVGDISEADWVDRFDWMKNTNGAYFVLVITKDEKVIATGTLIVEKKLYVFNLEKTCMEEFIPY